MTCIPRMQGAQLSATSTHRAEYALIGVFAVMGGRIEPSIKDGWAPPKYGHIYPSSSLQMYRLLWQKRVIPTQSTFSASDKLVE